MNGFEIAIGIVLILVSLIIIAVILLQEGHRAGVNSAVSGAADTFLSKNRGRTNNARFARWTKVVAIAFFVLAILANVIALYK